MFQFVAQRLFLGVFTLVIIAIINFLLIRAAPGDPATVMAGEAGAADEIFMQQLRERFSLDEPILVQLWSYLVNLAHLDLGMSYRQNKPVLELILDRLPATLLLTGSAFILSIVIGIIIGMFMSAKVGSWKDTGMSVLVTVFYATPVYWLAIVSILVFSVWNPWLPAFGYETIGSGYTGLARAGDVAMHMIQPTVVLATFYIAIYARMTRVTMLEVAGQDFVKTARAKGLSQSRILRSHVLRNALLPVVTLAGLQAGAMVGGAVLIETVFAWPGMGRLLFEALTQRDYSLLLGTFLVTAALAIVFNIITDVIYTFVDPRIEL
ncbi:ABC transporter permease [Ochrobactrum sp. BTU1]|uniref:ABC transporter permease n=1 Tax=Ochrobactrum sp. BTU1 TaxID=2840456 RepID=UPI001C04EE70|nr:ABC transporter permease [Ochrobactrum sp. BTU1]